MYKPIIPIQHYFIVTNQAQEHIHFCYKNQLSKNKTNIFIKNVSPSPKTQLSFFHSPNSEKLITYG